MGRPLLQAARTPRGNVSVTVTSSVVAQTPGVNQTRARNEKTSPTAGPDPSAGPHQLDCTCSASTGSAPPQLTPWLVATSPAIQLQPGALGGAAAFAGAARRLAPATATTSPTAAARRRAIRGTPTMLPTRGS